MFFLHSRKRFSSNKKLHQFATNTNKIEDEYSSIAHDHVGNECKEEM